jgi:hypothetical protein
MQSSDNAFLRTVAMTVVIVVCSIGCLNFLIDPYYFTGAPVIAGFNAKKTLVHNHLSLTKPYQAIGVRARAYALGSSHVDVGISPHDPAWPQWAQPVYNLGVPGSDAYDLLRQFQHAVAVGTPRLVVLGLEFDPFFTAPGPPATRPFEARLLVTPDGQPNRAFAWHRYKDLALRTLSVDATVDSVATLLAQQRTTELPLDANGLSSDALRFRKYVANYGHARLFEEQGEALTRSFLKRRRRIGAPRLNEHQLAAIGEVIGACAEHRIALRIFLYPAHAEQLEIYRALDLWPTYEDWKRALVELVAARSGIAFPQTADIELWDFSGYHRYATEEVTRGPKETMQWYWEPLHYKRALGSLMLAAMLSPADAPFGARIDRTNIDAHLQALRDGQSRYHRSHLEVVTRIAALADKSRAETARRRASAPQAPAP